MRILLLTFGVVTLLASRAAAQTDAEGELWLKLTKGPGSVEALEQVLKKPDEYSGVVLYGGALRAFEEKRLEDAGFLLYAGQLRVRFDRECFPPKGKGGDDPSQAYAALSMPIGSAINPAVMDDPAVFEKVLARLRKWKPKAPESYDPGYEYTQRKTEKEAHKAAKPNRTEFFDHMDDMCTLLKDKEYLAASRIVRAYNLGDEDDDKRPTKEAHDKAVGTMKRIEKKTGLKGFQSNKDE